MGGDGSGRPSQGQSNQELEERLRLERERLAFTLRAAGIVAWEWNPATDRVTVSVDAPHLFKIEPGEMPRSSGEFFSFIHPDDRERVRAAVMRTLRGEGDYAEEFRIARGDGSIGWCVDKGRRVEDEPGAPRLSGIFVDITERKEREEEVEALNRALVRRAEELQTVLDVLPVGVLIAEDPSCTVIRANPAGAAMMGMGTDRNASKSGPDADELPFRMMRDGAEVPPDELPMQRSARTGEAIRGQEFEVIRGDGSVVHIAGDAMPLVDEHGRVRGSVGAVVDITERKRAEAAREEEARRKDEFLATLAHELRNPLAPIRMSLEILRRRGPIAAAQEPALGVIDRQVEQLSRLVDDLLDVSRITRGKVELRKEWIDVQAVVERALETSRPALDKSGHRPHVELPEESLRICGDPTRLSQALGNLLHNAAKHTPPEGDIWVSAERRGREVLIKVRDEGSGIPPDLIPRIFDLFSQADTSLERSQGGLGIGLTIAKQLVEMHGGHLVAASEGSGRGSEFTIELPYEAPQREARSATEQDGVSAAATERRVLVVDDNRDAADTLATVLELGGNEVTTAYGAREALEASRTFQPEIVFLDIGMPEMSGFDVARLLRQQEETREAVIVAITGWGQEADRRRAKAAGFDYHMVKPVAPEAVADVLRRSGRASPPDG